MLFRFAHLLTSAGIALAIAGAIESGDSTTSNDTSGRSLERIALILFAVLYVILFALYSQCFVYRARIIDSESPIFKALSIALPLLAPRLLFALLAAFQVATNIFNTLSQSTIPVVLSAIFVTLPEFIIAAVILRAGLTVPSLAQQRCQVEANRTKHAEV